MKILLIEDDDSLITLLTRSLGSQHHIVDAVKDGEVGWTYASTFDYDLIILDIMLPKLDGISLCHRLRREGYTLPILLLTAQDHPNAKVQGLDAGADDYVVKPFDIAELIARVRALLRRGSANPLPLLSWGELVLNPSTCEVTYDGQPLTLTTKEYDLLELFLRESHQVISSDEIIDRLWSSDAFPTEATVRSHLRRLRYKLQVAGAPQDFISTIHGRGYYLKSSQSDLTCNGDLQISLADKSPDNTIMLNSPEQQYLSFLQETWVATKTQCLQSLAEIMDVAEQLLAGQGVYADQQQAHHLAHKLAGTLGIFSLLSAMEIAREIENLLDRSTLLPPADVTTIQTLLGQLAQEIAENAPRAIVDYSHPYLPLLLLINLEPTLNLSLGEIAENHHFRTVTLATIDAANSYLTRISDTPINMGASPVVLINLSTSHDQSLADRPLLGFVHNVHQRFPHWSIFAIGERDGLHERLAVLRHGARFLGTLTLKAEQIFMAITNRLQPNPAPTKVMIVDDDVQWLRALPQLLQPWGMNVTTLADPQQFWTVLRLVQPDALVLDVKMPEINGLELCQVLRSDVHWQSLPILFLSVHNNSIAQQEAFSAGADDYLCKPILGSELAQRIRHRLARLQAGQVAT